MLWNEKVPSDDSLFFFSASSSFKYLWRIQTSWSENLDALQICVKKHVIASYALLCYVSGKVRKLVELVMVTHNKRGIKLITH